MVMDPPGQIAPIAPLLVLIREPGDDDGCAGDRISAPAPVPNMAFGRIIVRGTVKLVNVPKAVERG